MLSKWKTEKKEWRREGPPAGQARHGRRQALTKVGPQARHAWDDTSNGLVGRGQAKSRGCFCHAPLFFSFLPRILPLPDIVFFESEGLGRPNKHAHNVPKMLKVNGEPREGAWAVKAPA